VIACGSPEEVSACEDSATGQFLRERLGLVAPKAAVPSRTRSKPGKKSTRAKRR
jgi:excinuclease UvrABC ATPase subunit